MKRFMIEKGPQGDRREREIRINKNGPHRELWRGGEGKDKEIEEKER